MPECIHCGATDDEDHGVIVGLYGGVNETTCNVCLSDHISGETTLSNRESQVAALKILTGRSHSEIAEVLDGVSKSNADKYSERINAKMDRAERTLSVLDDL